MEIALQVTLQVEIQEDNEGVWGYKLYRHATTYLPNIKHPVVRKRLLTERHAFASEEEAFEAAHRWMSVTNLAYQG